ncbi:SDR family oxidoreductase [Sulfuritalea hydrogenivorans]|uniref:Short chain dehydrogenase n=1 Tax=Sulfuritalea hydrogenivorans sk43H TaxID=1223802 RepID=W0SBH9_9PROT|nr:SDR family oxidoreductase [Sulfuritalea hydrogenivorans]MDK9714012.1 SDR family oxidoreductase [Sulfuritalea sp.]BAO28110.1 short chain dehydrogenase [Sulfuritalea hydrogenivorans sk43H]
MRVFITGASSGIGEALARHYAAMGATLGLAARRQHRLSELIAGLPGEHACYPLDVADAAALQAAAADFIAHHGVPDIVIANAGVSVGTLADEADDLPALNRVFQTNVMGMAQTLQPFIGAMKARGSGRLVGIASVAGIRGLPGAGAYSASKAAAITFLESLRVELRGSGVKVVTIAPGYIATPMTAVNSYPMPFILPADKAARRFSRAIERGTSYTVIPWQMGIVAKLMRLLPNPVFDAIFARGGRKPRGLDL